MKQFDNYDGIIAIQEKSAGHGTIGNCWLETKSFSKDTPIHKIIEWAKYCSGKLIITIDERNATDKPLNF